MTSYHKKINMLLRKIRNGDEKSKETLFKMTYNHLKGIALLYLKIPDDAEDVLVNSFLRVFRYIDSFNEKKGDGYSWLCKIVQREAYAMNDKIEKFTPEIAVTESDEGQTYEKIEYAQFLDKLLSGLTNDERKLIYMRFYEDKSCAEIARELGIKRTAVNMRISRITKKILEKYEKNGV